MTDIDKVLTGLECLITNEVPCDGCPYYASGYCTKNIAADALELLKEQDKIIKLLTEEKEGLLSERIAELQHNVDALHAAMQDTIFVNNAIEQRKSG